MSQFTDRYSSKKYFFNTCFDKNQLKNLISWFITHSGEKKTVDFLETVKQVGFHQATIAGVSLGLDDLQIPSQKSLFMSQAKADVSFSQQQNRSGNLTSVEKSQRMISTWNQTSDLLRKTAVQNFKTTNQLNPVYMMAFSGARGNISQVRQLVAMRGLMADPQGAIVEFPIQSNFREGLTLTEYLISCFGARKGLVDTALRTATSGYLTRRLVDAAQHIIVSLRDCGTKEGYRLKNKNLEFHLVGRVLAQDLFIDTKLSLKKNQIISSTLAKVISKNVKQVFVRSPLTCQADNSICQLCYGWNLAHGKLVNLGDAVGVIAAQSIGEPGTQLTMRTFHTGGVGVFSEQAMKYFRAPYDGIIHYSEGLPGHFVRNPHGKIVYMLRASATKGQISVLKLKPQGLKNFEFSLKKQDLPAGTILLTRQGEEVKTGQIIAQVPLVKQSKQKLPESTHPVFSPLAGEIVFESMFVLKQKKLPANLKKRIQKRSKKDEKQIGPIFRTLNGVGAFWVFSSQNQKELQTGKTLLRPGDLVSTKTLLFQYDFFVVLRSIFNIIDNKLSLGLHAIYLPVEKIRFHKRIYSFVLKPFSPVISKKQSLLKIKNSTIHKKEFLFFTKKRLQFFLIWFPTGSLLPDSGYFFNSRLYSERKSRKLINSSFGNTKNPQNLLTSSFYGNLFYLLKPIKKWKTNSSFVFRKNSTSFLLNLQSKNQRMQHSFVQCLQKNQNWQKKTQSKIKYCYYLHKKYIVRSNLTHESIFLKQALKNVKSSYSTTSLTFSSYVQEKKGWLFVPSLNKEVQKRSNSPKFQGKEQGKIYNNFIFVNSKISNEKIPLNKIGFIKSFYKNNQSFLENTKENKKTSLDNSKTNWYLKKYFLEKEFFLIQNLEKTSSAKFCFSIKTSTTSILKNKAECYVYYQLEKQNSSLKTNQPNLVITRPLRKNSNLNFHNKIHYFLFVSKLNEFYLPKKRDLTRQWDAMKSLHLSMENSRNPYYLKNSPFVIKQEVTNFIKKHNQLKNPQLVVSESKGWFSRKNFYKFLINLNSPHFYKQVYESFLISKQIKTHRIQITGFQLFRYDFLSFPENTLFDFEIFQNKRVLPSAKLLTSFIPITNSGEIRSLKDKNNTTTACILTRQNLRTVDLSKVLDPSLSKNNKTKSTKVKLGAVIRSGTEVFAGIASLDGGLILNKTLTTFTLRCGIPFLASSRGICHIFDQDLVEKNDLLVTLKSKRFQTEDIVQGIPKIEQLFEARETQGGLRIQNSPHNRLKKYFVSSLKSKNISLTRNYEILERAVIKSYKKIQVFLVQSIYQAYASQGVKISQKHIEIIVREMTRRVRIVHGGGSGLLAGELIPFTRIQKLNQELFLLKKHTVVYEPVLLGITKSVLQSDSFLVAASFQEVSRVLVRSALARKTDFLRGLHENVIVGQVIPSGTGLLSKQSILSSTFK